MAGYEKSKVSFLSFASTRLSHIKALRLLEVLWVNIIIGLGNTDISCLHEDIVSEWVVVSGLAYIGRKYILTSENL